jgi:Tfp pilus assembly protein PilX
MRSKNCRNQKGVALLLSILALLLLSAIAVSMMYMSSTESSVSANFKNEETQYFSARAGIEEVRDRMIPGVAPYSINGLAAGPNPPCPGSPNCYLPTLLPTATNGQVVYMLQNGVTTDNVTNFNSQTGCPAGQPGCMVDDELCHDYTVGGMQQSNQPNVRCATTPNGNNGNGGAWYSIPGAGIGANVAAPGLAAGSPGLSVAPNWPTAGSQNPLNWKWARITLKANNSTPYCVDGTCALGAIPVCWDGVSEKPLTAATCALMPRPSNPVYLVTALAVNNSGARRLIQADLAQTPVLPTPGLFATGNGCGGAGNNPPIIPFVFGGNGTTYSFNSAADGGAVPTTANGLALTTGGNIGANGGISMLGTSSTINGTVSSTLNPGTAGPCPNTSVTINGGGKITGTPQTAQLATPFTEAVPAIPNNVPTSACDNASPCWNVKGKKAGTLSPGTYGNISLSNGNTLTLQGGTVASPAVYNINSLSVQGNSTIQITGPVILNFAGNNIGNNPVIDFTGGSLTNTTNIPGDLVINYGGQGTFNTATNPPTSNPTIIINGSSGVFASINAPLANLKFTGGGNFYGAAVAETIDDQGGTNFYWDTSLNNTPNTSPYVEISMRELNY